MSSATKLKEEGNSLFRHNKYTEASQKYSEVIKLDEANAILYTNRAACWLNLKKYTLAVLDATKARRRVATELDPGYLKAHTRLATARDALDQPWNSRISWKAALEVLPQDLDGEQKKVKEVIEAGLDNAMKKLDAYNPKNIPPEWRGTPKFPIIQHCALAMLPELEKTENYDSFAWYMSDAYLHLENFITITNAYQTRPEHMKIVPKAIYHLSESLLRDSRSFRADADRHNWESQINQQLNAESRYYMGWGDSTAKEVIASAPERLTSDGWDVLRPALDTTIRAWIITGYLTEGQESSYFLRAIKVIEWGRSFWTDVGSTVRGNIFDIEYYLAVYKLYMGALGKGMGDDTKEKQALKAAEHILKTIESVGMPKQGQSDMPRHTRVHAFYRKPWSAAMMMKGTVLTTRGTSTKDLGMLADGVIHMELSVSCIPQDDFDHAYHLGLTAYRAISSMAPIAAYIKLLKDFKSSLEKSTPIWGEDHWMSSVGTHIKQVADQILPLEGNMKHKIASGELTEDSMVFGSEFLS